MKQSATFVRPVPTLRQTGGALPRPRQRIPLERDCRAARAICGRMESAETPHRIARESAATGREFFVRLLNAPSVVIVPDRERDFIRARQQRIHVGVCPGARVSHHGQAKRAIPGAKWNPDCAAAFPRADPDEVSIGPFRAPHAKDWDFQTQPAEMASKCRDASIVREWDPGWLRPPAPVPIRRAGPPRATDRPGPRQPLRASSEHLDQVADQANHLVPRRAPEHRRAPVGRDRYSTFSTGYSSSEARPLRPLEPCLQN